jgi:hypothetical protein
LKDLDPRPDYSIDLNLFMFQDSDLFGTKKAASSGSSFGGSDEEEEPVATKAQPVNTILL